MQDTKVENYSWGEYDFSQRDIKILDTSLRDGAQDAELRHPTLKEKEQFLDRLIEVGGIDAIDIAIPVARGRHFEDAVWLAKRLPSEIDIVCLARTQEVDIRAAVDLAQAVGRSVEAIVFVGSSRVRREIERWRVDQLISWMEKSVTLASKEGLIPNIATEHTTETEPEVIERIYRTGLECGGKRVCIADTTGEANVISTQAIVDFFKKTVLKGFDGIGIDWHGHNDRGLAVANSIAALYAGADRAHTTVRGIGERAGNTNLTSLFINLKMAGDPRRQELTRLLGLEEYSAQIFGVPIISNEPGIGSKVGTTASGIHAAAMRKDRLNGEPCEPYSAVKQEWFGRVPGVKIGPLSGAANVLEVASRLNLNVSEGFVGAVLEFAKASNRILTDDDVINIARNVEGRSTET